MKYKLLLLTGLSALAFNTVTFANCLSFSCGEEQPPYPACAGSLCRYDTPCECADYGWYFNNCISKCRYCEAFGNIGAR